MGEWVWNLVLYTGLMLINKKQFIKKTFSIRLYNFFTFKISLNWFWIDSLLSSDLFSVLGIYWNNLSNETKTIESNTISIAWANFGLGK